MSVGGRSVSLGFVDVSFSVRTAAGDALGIVSSLGRAMMNCLELLQGENDNEITTLQERCFMPDV
jgi:hypothetical protein